MNRTTIAEVRTRRLNAMTTAERTEFNEALATARLIIGMSEKIRAARQASGLSRRELAERISTSPAEVERIETGNADASLVTLSKAATTLGLELHINPVPAPAPDLDIDEMELSNPDWNRQRDTMWEEQLPTEADSPEASRPAR